MKIRSAILGGTALLVLTGPFVALTPTALAGPPPSGTPAVSTDSTAKPPAPGTQVGMWCRVFPRLCQVSLE